MAYLRKVGTYHSGRTSRIGVLKRHLKLSQEDIPEGAKFRETYTFFAQDGSMIDVHLTPIEFYLAVATIIGVEAANNRCESAFCTMPDQPYKS